MSQYCAYCGEVFYTCEWCGCCEDCCECDDFEEDPELFDADELGLDPEQDDERKYGNA